MLYSTLCVDNEVQVEKSYRFVWLFPLFVCVWLCVFVCLSVCVIAYELLELIPPVSSGIQPSFSQSTRGRHDFSILDVCRRCPPYIRSVTYTLADAGAFDLRTANETRIASATIVPPMAFMIMPSSVHSEYFELLARANRTQYYYHVFFEKWTRQTTNPNVNRAFSVRPEMQVAHASMNVTRPKLAWIGTIAERQPNVPLSQHRNTKNL